MYGYGYGYGDRRSPFGSGDALLSVNFDTAVGVESYKGIISNDGAWINGSWETTYAAFGIYSNSLGHPAALRVAAHNRTYVGYQDRNTDPQIIYFDHGAQAWSAPVKIATNPLGTGDDHGPPILVVDAAGSIYAFYGSHSTAQKVKKSNAVGDISVWTPKTDMDAFASYPQPHMRASGTMQVFYRRSPSLGVTGRYYSFKTTADGADTWSAATDIVYFADDTNIYGIVCYESDTVIHLAWFKWQEPGVARRNVYYAKSVDGGATWTKADGSALTLPINEASAEKVVDSGGSDAYIWDLKVDAGGKPVILFNTGTDAAANYKCARWNGSSWVISTIVSTHWARNLGALDCVSATIYDAYVTKGSFAGRGGELMRYRSLDSGATWALAESLMPGATFKGFSPQVVKNYDSDVKVVWGTGYHGFSNVAFAGDAPAKVSIATRPTLFASEANGGVYDESNTEQFRSSPQSLKLAAGTFVHSPALAAALGTIVGFYTYISSTTGRANTIAILDSGGDVSGDSGAYLKFEAGVVYAFNGSVYVDTTLTYGTGWIFVRIVQRATDFDLTVGASTKIGVANRNTITNVNKLFLEGNAFANWYDDIVVRA